MSKRAAFGFEIVTRRVPESGRKDATPFRILVMGDFSGRGDLAPAGSFDPAVRRVYRVDAENLDDIIGKTGVEVRLPLNGDENPPVAIRFSCLDDFRPEALFRNLEVFASVKEARKRISEPGFFARRKEGSPMEGPASAPHSLDPKVLAETLVTSELESQASLFQDLLKKPAAEPRESRSNVNVLLENFLKKVVSPHLDPDADLRQAALKGIEEIIGALVRAILHYPDFQAVEAAWRGLDFLVSRVETGGELQICLLDISKAELASDLCLNDNLAESATYRLLVEQTLGTPGAEAWSLIVGNYTFECLSGDIGLLGRIAKIAEAAGAAFIAQAGSSLLGCKSISDISNPREWKWPDPQNPDGAAWEALRRIPQASWVGLALPPILLRLPYGTGTEPVEGFAFEEFEGVPEHERYLWGNAAFFCASLVAQSFMEEGWDFKPGSVQEANGFPVHTYISAGKTVSTPCAGVLLTQTAAEAILEKGIMPLLSYRDQDRVRLGRFQSIAYPARALSGAWRIALTDCGGGDVS
jgi:type VI secretion system protein ImpC